MSETANSSADAEPADAVQNPFSAAAVLAAYTPRDWYWRRDDGALFGSADGRIVEADAAESDEAFTDWSRGGSRQPTRWPVDEAGAQTDAALQAVLTPYGLSVPGHVILPASVSSAQAKIQLLRTPGSAKDRTLFDDVKAKVDDAGGEVAVWFTDARTWERQNPYVLQLGAALKLKPNDIDALFVAAAQIAA